MTKVLYYNQDLGIELPMTVDTIPLVGDYVALPEGICMYELVVVKRVFNFSGRHHLGVDTNCLILYVE